MDVTYNSRGFASYGDEVGTTYGHRVRIQESSAAEYDACWMFIEKEEPEFNGQLPACDVGVHLNLEQAVAIRDRIDAWIRGDR